MISALACATSRMMIDFSQVILLSRLACFVHFSWLEDYARLGRDCETQQSAHHEIQPNAVLFKRLLPKSTALCQNLKVVCAPPLVNWEGMGGRKGGESTGAVFSIAGCGDVMKWWRWLGLASAQNVSRKVSLDKGGQSNFFFSFNFFHVFPLSPLFSSRQYARLSVCYLTY